MPRAIVQCVSGSEGVELESGQNVLRPASKLRVERAIWLTAPVGKCGDLSAAKCPLMAHQATASITMFGHRVSNLMLTE